MSDTFPPTPMEPTAPPPPPPPRRRRRRLWPYILGALLVLLLGVSFLLNLVFLAVLGMGVAGKGGLREELVTGDPLATEKIALVGLKGVIMDSGAGPFGTGAYRSAVEQLEQAAKDDKVKAIILAVDSPGGEVTASDVLSEKVRRVRSETGKPVVALLGGVAASGGYYVSAAADRIVAQPTTVTGSIGVIMSLINAQGLMEKVGLRSIVLKSAEFKDLGSPFREMAPEERALLQGVLDHLFRRFKRVVAEGRGLPAEKVDALADGRIFTAEEALEVGLIDGIGYLPDAVDEARKLAGVPQAKVIRYQHVFRLSELLGSRLQGLTPPSTITVRVAGLPGPRTARFLYLWTLGGDGAGLGP